MNDQSQPWRVSISASLLGRIDEICDQFEGAWLRAAAVNQRPHIEDFLSETPDRSLLYELIYLDITYRRRHGDNPRAQDYQGRFPTLDLRPLAAVFAEQPDNVPTSALAKSDGETTDGAGTDRSPRTQGTRVRCPHCHNPIQLVDQGSDEVLCPGCGSSFRIREARQTTTTQGMRPLGKFQLLERVGLGAFGAVWRARDTELDRIVALKIPHTGMLTASNDLERFHREARAAAQLRHPGVVTVHEVQTLDGLPTIVSDFIDGVTLKDYLEVRRLTFREAAELIAAVAEAVDYAHSMGLVHRDLKPANIMLESVASSPLSVVQQQPTSATGHGQLTTDQKLKPLVMDFGLALRNEAEITMTLDGHIIGTPAYMSTEQAAGKGHQADRRSDVYSLGVILYELLTGELPFRGSKMMILHQVLHEEPRRPRRLNERIPRDLETICLKALPKAPGRRYATARELADDLRRYLSGEPIRARRIGNTERLWRWCRRNPALAAACGLAAAALVAAAGVAISFGIYQSHTAASEANLRRQAERSLAGLTRQQGLTLCDQGSVGSGLPFLARSLEIVPANEEEFQRDVRADLARWHRQFRPLRALLDHPGGVSAQAFSPDGRTVLTGGADGAARLWEAATGKLIGSPVQHRDRVVAVAFSPDGKTFLTGSRDHTARLWEVSTGKPLGQPLQHASSVEAVAFSPDGKTILTGSGDGTAQLWEATTGKPIGKPLQHKKMVTVLALSPDGRTALTGSHDATARLWDAATGEPRGAVAPAVLSASMVALGASPTGTTPCSVVAALMTGRTGAVMRHRGWVKAGVFSPDGRTVLIGSADATARLWDAASGNPVGPELSHRGPVEAVAFSPDGTTLLTGSGDGTARLWEAVTGKALAEPLQHHSKVRAVGFSPDGSKALTGSTDRTARLWDVATGKPTGPPFENMDEVWGVAFSPDGQFVLTGNEGDVRLWEAALPKLSGAVLRHEHWVAAVAFSPDGTKLLTGTGDPVTWKGEARLWDAVTRKPIGQAFKHKRAIPAVAFSPDGRRFVTASGHPFFGAGKAGVWEVDTGKAVGQPLRHSVDFLHPDVVLGVAFSPDGQTVLTGSRDRTAKLWNATTGDLIRTFPHGDGVCAVAFSPDGKTILTGGEDRVARLWEVDTGNRLGQPLDHSGLVMAVAFSPDGKTIATGCEDRTARLWETATGKPLRTVQHQGWVRGVAFSPDGKLLLTGSADGTARLWESATGKPIGAPFRHKDWVIAVAFSPDGSTILTGSRDGTARLWEIAARVEGTVEQLVLWTQAITGMEVEPGGVVRVQDAQTWRQRRQHLSELGGPPTGAAEPGGPPGTEPELLAWHQEKAENCHRTGQWFGAAFHFSYVIDLEPGQALPRARRGWAYAQLGQWQKATLDYAKATALEPNNVWHVWTAHEHAGILLMCGDTEGYRQTCAYLLQRFGQTTQPTTAYLLARTFVLAPNAAPDAAKAVELAARAVAREPKHAWHWHTLGLAYYRAGEFEQAIRQLHHALEMKGRDCDPLNWLVLAMVYQRQGKTDEARQCLDKALPWSNRLVQNLPPGAPNAIKPHLHDWTEYHLLRREAEALISRDEPSIPK